MPRSLLGTTVLNPIVQEACPAPAPAPAPAPSQVAAGGYVEIHGDEADWRLKIGQDGGLRVQKLMQGLWRTASSFQKHQL